MSEYQLLKGRVTLTLRRTSSVSLPQLMTLLQLTCTTLMPQCCRISSRISCSRLSRPEANTYWMPCTSTSISSRLPRLLASRRQQSSSKQHTMGFSMTSMLGRSSCSSCDLKCCSKSDRREASNSLKGCGLTSRQGLMYLLLLLTTASLVSLLRNIAALRELRPSDRCLQKLFSSSSSLGRSLIWQPLVRRQWVQRCRTQYDSLCSIAPGLYWLSMSSQRFLRRGWSSHSLHTTNRTVSISWRILPMRCLRRWGLMTCLQMLGLMRPLRVQVRMRDSTCSGSSLALLVSRYISIFPSRNSWSFMELTVASSSHTISPSCSRSSKVVLRSRRSRVFLLNASQNLRLVRVSEVFSSPSIFCSSRIEMSVGSFRQNSCTCRPSVRSESISPRSLPHLQLICDSASTIGRISFSCEARSKRTSSGLNSGRMLYQAIVRQTHSLLSGHPRTESTSYEYTRRYSFTAGSSSSRKPPSAACRRLSSSLCRFWILASRLPSSNSSSVLTLKSGTPCWWYWELRMSVRLWRVVSQKWAERTRLSRIVVNALILQLGCPLQQAYSHHLVLLILIIQHTMPLSPQLEDFYVDQLKQWVGLIKLGNNPEDYYSQFLKIVKQKMGVAMTFDNSILSAFLNIMDQFSWQPYSTEEGNVKRNALMLVGEVLYSQRYFGRQALMELQSHQPTYIKSKLQQFLNLAQGTQKSQLEQLWEIVVGYPLEQVQTYLDQQNIEDSVACQARNMLKPPQIEVEEVRQEVRLQPPRQEARVDVVPDEPVQEYDEYEDMDETRLVEVFNRLNISSILYQHPQQNQHPQFEYQAPTMDKTLKFEANTVSKPIINQLLKEISSQQAVFLHPKHANLRNGTLRIIEQVKQIIAPCPNVKSVEQFGSLVSHFALSSDLDIDLTVMPNTSFRGNAPSRKTDTELLWALKRSYFDEVKPYWIEKAWVIHHENVPVPFIKITLCRMKTGQLFKVRGIGKVDLTVRNQTAVSNSRLLSKYSHNQEVLLFVLLVKLWAKKSDIINTKSPKDGLTGYGIVLMCLFYLMETHQIPRLKGPQYDDFQSHSFNPLPPNCRLDPLADNFTQFLTYYDVGSIFHRHKKIASLVVRPPSHIYDPRVIINMYDFIDETNPGRLTHDFDDKFFGAIRQARQAMSSGHPTAIYKLFE